MNFIAYRLYFDGPIHISDPRGDYGNGEPRIHSDSFYAGLIAALAKIKQDLAADLGCTISSLYPFTTAKDVQDIIYFFPKPLMDLNVFAPGFEDIKQLKKIEWLDKDYFQNLLQGKNKNDISERDIKKSYLTKAEIISDFISREVVPRVAVPRSPDDNDGKTNIFYVEKTYFNKGSGLFFLMQGENILLEKALNVLQHEGIGTDRNIGFGTFTFLKDENFEILTPNNTEYSLSLSLFNPDDNTDVSELTDGKHASWEVIKRGGWITSEGNVGIRKKSIYMFREGSMFFDPDQRLRTAGKPDIDLVPDAIEGFTAPKHPIWRTGRSLFIPIKILES